MLERDNGHRFQEESRMRRPVRQVNMKVVDLVSREKFRRNR